MDLAKVQIPEVPNQPLPSPPNSDLSLLEIHDGKEARDSKGVIVVGKATRIVGDIAECDEVEVMGHVEGVVTAERVVVCEGGTIQGGLRAAHAEIHGLVDGEVRIDELLDVRSTARVFGDLAYGRLVVAGGGDIAGTVHGADGAAPREALPSERSKRRMPYGRATQVEPCRPPPVQRRG